MSAEAKDAARRDTVNSSLKFADTFPQHEHAAVVLGAAAEDLYDMKDFALATSSAQKLIDSFPNAAPPVRRTAWVVVAHSSFDLAEYQPAEQAYTRVLEATPQDDNRVRRWWKTWPPRSTSRASRRMSWANTARRPTISCASGRPRRRRRSARVRSTTQALH